MVKRPKYAAKRPNVILVQDRVSHSSKRQLRPALRARRITPYSVGVRPIPEQATIINFGGGALPVKPPESARVLNPPDKVAICSNKLETFKLLKEAKVPTVRWTVDPAMVRKWLGKGNTALARLNVSSSGGRGIRVLAGGPEIEIPAAPLYTRYFPKTHEFRVHVVNGEVVDFVEKKIREELKDDANRRVIRNHRNGWVFAHDNLSLNDPGDIDTINSISISACRSLGLDFGAVDILAALGEEMPRRLIKAVVCEVNSAPGIENTKTLEAYVRAFNKVIENAH